MLSLPQSFQVALAAKKNKARLHRALFSFVKPVGLALIFNTQVIESFQFGQRNCQRCLSFSH